MVSPSDGLWYSRAPMIPLPQILLALFLMVAPGTAQPKGPDAISRVFKHNNGQTTETQKMGGENKIRERVFDKNKILSAERIFTLDNNGRILTGVIYDGKGTPLGSTVNQFDPQTGRMLMETLYNHQGKVARVLYYPGALKDPRFSKRMVAFNYDVSDAKAAPKQVAGDVKPIVPATKNEDDFEPGMPQGTAAPTAQEAARNRKSVAVKEALPPRRSWLKQKKP